MGLTIASAGNLDLHKGWAFDGCMKLLQDLKLLGTEAGLNFSLKLDPGKRFYCLFGKNGVGKTNLLQNLGRLLLLQHSMFLEPRSSESNLRFRGLFRNAAVSDVLASLPFRLPDAVRVFGIPFKDRWQVTTAERWHDSGLEYFQSGLVSDGDEPKGANWIIDRPVVVIGTSGRGHTPNVGKQELAFVGSAEQEFVKAYRRTWSAAMAESIPTEGVAAWIAARLLVNPAFVEGSASRADEVIALCELLAELDPAFQEYLVEKPGGGKKLAISFRNGALWFGPTPIDKLATGYLAVVKIFQEIISAYGAWGGMVGEQNIREQEGLVLIDELEAHLHPRWQVDLVPLLKRAFPKTTFVVCTHSPIVVAQTEEGEAYELLRTGSEVVTERLGSPRDWYLADVYANAFHIEVPTPGTSRSGSEPSLNELMMRLSDQVKDFLKQRSDGLRSEAMTLADKITARLPDDDPRRRSVASLRSLLG